MNDESEEMTRQQHGPAADQTADEVAAEQAPGPTVQELKRILEAVLFSSSRPISSSQLAEVSGAANGRDVRKALKELQQEYEAEERSFAIEELAGGFQVLTRPEYDSYIARLHSRQQDDTLSKAALETLAIVAYRQPITRAEVEDIRGVGAGHILRSLVEKRLLKVAGKSDELGRALLYGTTKQFLQVFGLRSLSELPKRSEFATSRPSEKQDQGQQGG